MLNVMIVEDEMLVRLGFKNTVPWDKYGMNVCADMANGLEAWNYYKNSGTKPDVIVTDLMMPEMDGLELIRKIRKEDSRTRIVILSCMEDFHLVRQAMNIGVSSYILKLTMTPDEIGNVLIQVRDELGAQESIEASKGIIHNPDYLKENVMKNFVFYNLYSESEFARHISKLKLRLSPERLVVCMMEIDSFGQMQEKLKDEKGELIRVTILNVLGEVLDQSKRGEAVSDDDKRYLLLFSFQDMVSEVKIREELVWILTQIQKVLKRFFNISVSFGVSGMKSDYVSLRALYRESREAVNRKFFYGTGQLMFFSRQETMTVNEWVKKKIEEAAGERSAVGSAASLLSGELRDAQDVRMLFIRLLHSMAATIAVDRQKADLLITEKAEEIRKVETLDEIAAVFASFLTGFDHIHGTQKQLSKEIARAVKIVQERYSSNLTLPQLADTLEISPNYLSTLFKQELRLNFSDYLTRVRLEKAKELLLNTHLKSYEIAEKTGFADDSYFSRTFMKHAGVRPNAFRRQWVQDRITGAGNEDGE